LSVTEIILLIATAINALAAAGSAWFAFKTVRISERMLDDQQKIREFERKERKYEQLIVAPMRAYLSTLSTEWYEMLQDGLSELDKLVVKEVSRVELAAHLRRLTFSLRETWRYASFDLLSGADAWNRALSRELESARDELDADVARILNEHVARLLPGRPIQHSLALAIRKHAMTVLDAAAKYIPDGEALVGFVQSGRTRVVRRGATPDKRMPG
jgi:hypothetical protein